MRQGRDHLLVLGKRVPLPPVLGRAAEEIGGVALEALRQALRREATNVDLVMVAGGGGALYGRAVAALFPVLRCVWPVTRWAPTRAGSSTMADAEAGWRIVVHIGSGQPELRAALGELPSRVRAGPRGCASSRCSASTTCVAGRPPQ